jgi:hypothetical protein
MASHGDGLHMKMVVLSEQLCGLQHFILKTSFIKMINIKFRSTNMDINNV